MLFCRILVKHPLASKESVSGETFPICKLSLHFCGLYFLPMTSLYVKNEPLFDTVSHFLITTTWNLGILIKLSSLSDTLLFQLHTNEERLLPGQCFGE